MESLCSTHQIVSGSLSKMTFVRETTDFCGLLIGTAKSGASDTPKPPSLQSTNKYTLVPKKLGVVVLGCLMFFVVSRWRACAGGGLYA